MISVRLMAYSTRQTMASTAHSMFSIAMYQSEGSASSMFRTQPHRDRRKKKWGKQIWKQLKTASRVTAR